MERVRIHFENILSEWIYVYSDAHTKKNTPQMSFLKKSRATGTE